MLELLSVREAAELHGCSEQYLRKKIACGAISAQETVGENRHKKYLIPLSALEPGLQRKYYQLRGEQMPETLRQRKERQRAGPVKPLDAYTAEQREEIDRWITILTDWRAFRAQAESKVEADKAFLAEAAERYGSGVSISKDTLYRKWEAYQMGNLDGLVDKRGRKKGVSDVPQVIKDLFLYTYLDETALPVSKCMEAVELILRKEQPKLLDQIPSYATFVRWAHECPVPLATLARDGEKAFNDRCGLYVSRFYDDMVSNDYWIADGHTIDVITKMADGSDSRRRLTLSAFIDARSGIYVGWVVTDHPSSDATLLALRKAILKYGIPRHIYVDNGREYLNTDIGGTGHRTRKRKVEVKLPTPILTRLGIQMTNALPRNAQAKIIEREFRNFTFLSRLFETYCGSNPVVKPEKLKHKLKAGHIPLDGELARIVDDMIEGYFNLQPYNGKVARDKGKTKLEVYQQYLTTVRKASEDDLNLMMMRSERLQTIGRNGVYVRVSGEKLFYYDDELMMMQGQKVFVRYDPEAMETVRVYDEDEKFLKTVSLATELMSEYGDSKEKIAGAMAEKRRWHRKAKDAVAAQRQIIVSQYGHINMLDLFVRAAHENREGLLDTGTDAEVIELVTPEERRVLPEAVGSETVVIDRSRIIKNNENK